MSIARLDLALVERGLADSREKAQALIMAGAVFVDGQRREKPGQRIPPDARVEVTARLPFVSRGGIKLAAALDHWKIDVTGRLCLDVGASTGGFTDCLLQRGASRVHAVDTGAGQLDWKLRSDPRVVLHENCNARHLQTGDIGDSVAFAAMDVSFISATLIVPALAGVLQPGAGLVILVKPQFEVGREQVGKGGIVRDPALHDWACRRVAECVAATGRRTALIESPIRGAEGNREFLLYGFHD